MRRQALAAFALLLTLPLTAAAQERCAVRRDVDRQLDAADLDGVLVEAESGFLEVTGADVDRVRVQGVLCASDEDLAADARLVLERRRDAAWIEADLPDVRGGWRGEYVRMDLTVEMPRSLAADVRDGSGEIMVRGIEAVRIDDGSGEMDIRDVAGAVVIDDGSGAIRVERAGSVEIDDGSGEIDIADVRGDVLVTEDGSGPMEIRDVAGDVRIVEDGSGSITVVGVGGDFVLEDDGSGSVSYRDVQGRVSVPPDRR